MFVHDMGELVMVVVENIVEVQVQYRSQVNFTHVLAELFNVDVFSQSYSFSHFLMTKFEVFH